MQLRVYSISEEILCRIGWLISPFMGLLISALLERRFYLGQSNVPSFRAHRCSSLIRMIKGTGADLRGHQEGNGTPRTLVGSAVQVREHRSFTQTNQVWVAEKPWRRLLHGLDHEHTHTCTTEKHRIIVNTVHEGPFPAWGWKNSTKSSYCMFVSLT